MSIRQDENPIPRAARIALAVIVVLGAVLRIRGLNAESVWIDEVLSVIFSTGSPRVILERLEPQHLPVYFWLNSLFLRISADEGWLRFGSALAGIATLPMIFLACATLGRVREGLSAALLASASGFLIHYSQEIRMYALVILLGMIGTWAVVSLGREPAIRRPIWRMVILLVVSVLNLYTSPFSAVMVAIHWGTLAVVAWRRPSLRLSYVVMAVLLALAYRPALIHMAPLVTGSADAVQQSASAYDSLWDLVWIALVHFGGLVPSAVPVIAVLGLAGCLLAWRNARLLVVIAVLSFAAPILALYVAKPGHFYNPRYLVCAQPHLLIMIAFTLVWVWDRTVGRIRSGPLPLRLDLYGAGVIGVVILVGLTLQAPDRELIGRKPDWRGVASTILADVRDGDVVAVLPHYQDNTVLYHLDSASDPGERPRLDENSGWSWYRMYRRRQIEALHPEEFAGPTITVQGLATLEGLADPRLRGGSGRVWLVTKEELPAPYAACYVPRFSMAPTLGFSGKGNTSLRQTVLYLGTDCPD